MKKFIRFFLALFIVFGIILLSIIFFKKVDINNALMGLWIFGIAFFIPSYPTIVTPQKYAHFLNKLAAKIRRTDITFPIEYEEKLRTSIIRLYSILFLSIVMIVIATILVVLGIQI